MKKGQGIENNKKNFKDEEGGGRTRHLKGAREYLMTALNSTKAHGPKYKLLLGELSALDSYFNGK